MPESGMTTGRLWSAQEENLGYSQLNYGLKNTGTEGWLWKGARIEAEMHSLTLLLPQTGPKRTIERIPMFVAGPGSQPYSEG